MQANLALALGAVINAIRVEATDEGLAAFGDGLGERAFEDAQPVAIAQHFVLGVNRSNRVFEVQDGGERGFHHQITHTSRIGGTDGRVAVDLQIQVQAVVLEQHR
ncbi:MAG: hypothetical protein RL163_1285 [Pseudomonadota bacterium]